MTDVKDPNDFYEDDEPVAEVVAAFDRAAKQLTRPPDLSRMGQRLRASSRRPDDE